VQIAGPDVLNRCRQCAEIDLQLSAEQVGNRLHLAAIGYVLHVDAGRHLEQFGNNMGQAPSAGRSIIELARVAFGVRRPLLVIALAAVPIRSALFGVTTDPLLLVVIQMLDGLSGATLGVLTTLVVADLTNGTGRFNLAQGLVGTRSGVGAPLSTSITGVVAQNFGDTAGLLSVTAVGLLSVAVALAVMPETKPSTPKGFGTPPQGLGVPLSPA
jgi:hypothetical protein